MCGGTYTSLTGYCLDIPLLKVRILAGQQGCEMTIMDNDCDLRPPDNLGAQTTDIQGRIALQSKLYTWTALHGKIIRILRDSPFLSEEEIDKLDERIQAQYEKVPTTISYDADDTDSPSWNLDNHILIDNTKFRVYRFNLTPNAPFASRLAALKRCIDMAKNASPKIAEKFKDEEITTEISLDEVREHNQRVVRIILPEHCQYFYCCAMYLIAAKLWRFALPFIIGLRMIGDKLAINKCCCRYLWGVINFTEDKESIISHSNVAAESWNEEEEEVIALIAADMHQDAKAWEMVWQKDIDQKPRTLDVPDIQEETETELPDDSLSISEASERRSSVKTSEVGEPVIGPSDKEPRPAIVHRWSGEDETWDVMVSYIRAKSGEDHEMESIEEMEDVVITGTSMSVQKEIIVIHESTKDEIQRRMSISNLL